MISEKDENMVKVPDFSKELEVRKNEKVIDEMERWKKYCKENNIPFELHELINKNTLTGAEKLLLDYFNSKEYLEKSLEGMPKFDIGESPVFRNCISCGKSTWWGISKTKEICKSCNSILKIPPQKDKTNEEIKREKIDHPIHYQD
jgi:hypothetical protein